jgi:hypothetical protein
VIEAPTPFAIWWSGRALAQSDDAAGASRAPVSAPMKQLGAPAGAPQAAWSQNCQVSQSLSQSAPQPQQAYHGP